MNRYLRSGILLSAFLFLVGCQTTEGVVLSETPLAIRQTRMTAVQALGEMRTISQNGREMTTHYHDRKLKFLDVTPKTQERLYTKVLILGARRPYDVVVQVRVEQRDPATRAFLDLGIEEALTMTQAKLMQQALNQSRDKGQAIDEGAPF